MLKTLRNLKNVLSSMVIIELITVSWQIEYYCIGLLPCSVSAHLWTFRINWNVHLSLSTSSVTFVYRFLLSSIYISIGGISAIIQTPPAETVLLTLQIRSVIFFWVLLSFSRNFLFRMTVKHTTLRIESMREQRWTQFSF